MVTRVSRKSGPMPIGHEKQRESDLDFFPFIIKTLTFPSMTKGCTEHVTMLHFTQLKLEHNN